MCVFEEEEEEEEEEGGQSRSAATDANIHVQRQTK